MCGALWRNYAYEWAFLCVFRISVCELGIVAELCLSGSDYFYVFSCVQEFRL